MFPRLCLDDLAALDAAGADAQLLCAAFDLRFDRTKIDVPAPLGDIVRVRDVVTELRTFAANCADLSHDSLQNLNFRADQNPLKLHSSLVRGGRASRQTDARTGAEFLV